MATIINFSDFKQRKQEKQPTKLNSEFYEKTKVRLDEERRQANEALLKALGVKSQATKNAN